MSEDRNARVVLSADVSGYQQQMAAAAASTNQYVQQLETAKTKQEGFFKSANTGLATFGKSLLSFQTGMVAISATLEKQMSTIEGVFASRGAGGGTRKEIGAIKDAVKELSSQLPIARGELAQLATSMSKMGVPSGSVNAGLLGNFAKLSSATGEDATGLASGMIGLSRQMGNMNFNSRSSRGTTAVQTNQRMNDSLNYLSAGAGVPAQSVLDFSQSIAPTGRSAGMSQQQVMGASTAFIAGGAEGGYAANAFTTILNEIMALRSTKSDQQGKYRYALGTSQSGLDQMKPFDIARKLIGNVGEGPEGVSKMNALGFDGVRMQKALQAVNAAGGMEKFTNDAMGGAGSVEEGSKAANGGLFDELEKIKNKFVNIGDTIGQVVLPIFTTMAKVVGAVISPFETLAKVFAPLITVVGTVASVLSKLGAVASFGGTAALISVLSRNALTKGFQRGKRGEMTPEKGSYEYSILSDEEKVRADSLSRTGRAGEKAGRRYSETRNAHRPMSEWSAPTTQPIKPDPAKFKQQLWNPNQAPIAGSSFGTAAEYALHGQGLAPPKEWYGSAPTGDPVRGMQAPTKKGMGWRKTFNAALYAGEHGTDHALGWYNSQMYSAAEQNPENRKNIDRHGRDRATGQKVPGLFGSMRQGYRYGTGRDDPTHAVIDQKPKATGSVSDRAVKGFNNALETGAKKANAAGTAQEELGKHGRWLGKSFWDLTKASAQASLAMAGMGMGRAAGAIANSGIGSAIGGGLKSAAGGISELLGGKLGMASMGIAATLTGAKTYMNSQEQMKNWTDPNRAAPMDMDLVNTQLKYNQAVGEATIQLGSFSRGLKEGNVALDKNSAYNSAMDPRLRAMGIAQKDYTDPRVGDLRTKEGATNFMLSQGIMSPEAVVKVVADINKNQRFTQSDVSEILDEWAKKTDQGTKVGVIGPEGLGYNYEASSMPNARERMKQAGGGVAGLTSALMSQNSSPGGWGGPLAVSTTGLLATAMDSMNPMMMLGNKVSGMFGLEQPSIPGTGNWLRNQGHKMNAMGIAGDERFQAQVSVDAKRIRDTGLAFGNSRDLTKNKGTDGTYLSQQEMATFKTLDTASKEIGKLAADLRKASGEEQDTLMAQIVTLAKANDIKLAPGATDVLIDKDSMKDMSAEQFAQFTYSAGVNGMDLQQRAQNFGVQNSAGWSKFEGETGVAEILNDVKTAMDKSNLSPTAIDSIRNNKDLQAALGGQSTGSVTAMLSAEEYLADADVIAPGVNSLGDIASGQKKQKVMSDRELLSVAGNSQPGESQDMAVRAYQRRLSLENEFLPTMDRQQSMQLADTQAMDAYTAFRMPEDKGGKSPAAATALKAGMDQERQGLIQYAADLKAFDVGRMREAEAFQRQRSNSEEDFNRTMSQSQEDYQRQVEWSEQDFYRSRARAIEDFNRQAQQSTDAFQKSQNRSTTDFNKSIARSKEDHAISLQRGEEDFNKGRQRSDYDFNKGLKRSADDFNLSRQRSQYDYNISKQRSIADFQKSEDRSIDDHQKSIRRSVFDYQKSITRSFDDHNKGKLRSIHDYNLSVERSTDDFWKNYKRGNDDFDKSIFRSTYDHGLSVTRAYDDRFTQVTRMKDDFNKQMLRGETDFNRSISYMMEDAAKGIYNVYERIYGVQTASGDTILSNMREQNAAIEKQRAQLDALKEKGMSQQTIDILGLTDPKNAQQLARLYQDVLSDPQLLQNINQEAANRQQSTTGLLDNEDNTSLRRQREEHQLQIDRSTEDFKLSLDRSTADFDLAMRRGETDFWESIRRATDDHVLSNERAVADFTLSLERSGTDFRLSLIRADDDFLLSIRRSGDDFFLSLERGNEDFNLSLERSRADFRLSLERSDIDFKLSMQRSLDDFRKSVTRSIEDYRLSVLRQLEDYRKALARGNADFVKSLRRSTIDFAISMARATADFALQMKISRDNFARSMARGNADFSRSQNHSLIQFNISMNRSVAAYHLSLKRASQERAIALNNQLLDFQGKTRRMGMTLEQLQRESSAITRKYFGNNSAAMDRDFARQMTHIRLMKLALAGLHPPTVGGTVPGGASSPNTGSGPSSGTNYGTWATGGIIKGPGTGTSDSITIKASNNEYVIRAAIVEKLGVEFFDQLNSGSIPRDALRSAQFNSQAAAKNSQVAGYGMSPSVAKQIFNTYNSTVFSGEVTVKANDPIDMARQLQQQARLKTMRGLTPAGR